jgi:hypothetical protein
MGALPRIPMRPEALPQQRLSLVVPLPPRPTGFAGTRDAPGSVPPSLKMPRSARYIGQVEWAWSMINARLDAYYLSTNRARTHWILWLRSYDDNWGRWDEPHIYAHAPRQNVSAKVAATYLLLDAWSASIAEYELDHFHWINKAAFLSVKELVAISRIAWDGCVVD